MIAGSLVYPSVFIVLIVGDCVTTSGETGRSGHCRGVDFT
jgi:hypothetical protein